MSEIGYALSSEEHTPNDLVQYAKKAEEAGFTFALISDHYHPWIDEQGHSPFVWSVIGGISQVTKNLKLGTGVTCPTMRTHPAIIAQAAATAAAMMPGRFFLGVGTGENLNEHILGDRWPPHDIRLDMLIEAIDLIRELWKGETVSWWGDYYTVEDARIYSLPPQTPQIMVAAGGSNSVQMAGEIGDGLITTTPKDNLVEQFEDAGGQDKPKYGQLTVCWAESEKEAEETMVRLWPNTGLEGELTQELRTVTHFQQAVKMLQKKDILENVILGPDPEEHKEGIQKFIAAGYDHVYVHQIGADQTGFFNFYKNEILPSFQ